MVKGLLVGIVIGVACAVMVGVVSVWWDDPRLQA